MSKNSDRHLLEILAKHETTYLTTANVSVPEPSVGGALQRKANRRKQLNLLLK